VRSGSWMSGSKIQLFRMLGITFQVDSAWLIVFALMTLVLASQFSKDYPHWSSFHYWSAGIFTCLLFFASIVFHELAHSLVAKVAGLPVRSITLFILGGISQIGKEVQHPGVEFLVAAAGPAASLALAAAFGLLWVASQTSWEIMGALAKWLMQINLLLVLFNLIPGFPLDGGRILRSILWGVSGNFSRATRMASAAGRGTAAVFFAGGLALLFASYFLFGLWAFFIGWFLWAASRQNERQLLFRESLAGLNAADVMISDCPRVEASSSLASVKERLSTDSASSCFLVLECGNLKGLISRDQLGMVSPEHWSTATVERVMTPLSALRWVSPQQDLLRVIETMDRDGISYVPVLHDGQVLGVVGRQEILQLLRSRFQTVPER
jgi:Zn-dependent protease/predicted transcriptional regulator